MGRNSLKTRGFCWYVIMPRPKRKAVEKDPIKQEVEVNPHQWPNIGHEATFMELCVFTYLNGECIEIKSRVSPRIPDVEQVLLQPA